MRKDAIAMLDKFEQYSDTMISNIIGLPLLACRVAKCADIISKSADIRTEKERNDFLIFDLAKYSDELKEENNIAYIFIDKYIDNLMQCEQ